MRISKISEIFWQWKIWLRFICNYFIILSLRLVCPIVVCACASWSVSFLLDVSSSTLLSTNSNYIFRLIQCIDLQINDFLLVCCLHFLLLDTYNLLALDLQQLITIPCIPEILKDYLVLIGRQIIFSKVFTLRNSKRLRHVVDNDYLHIFIHLNFRLVLLIFSSSFSFFFLLGKFSEISWKIILYFQIFIMYISYKWLYRLKKSKRWRNDLITKQEYKTYKWYFKK